MKLFDIEKSYGDNKIFDKFNLDIEEEKVTVILGKSGCGKTTLLQIICGFISDYEGEVIFENKYSQGVAYVFQDDALIPWKSVYENLEYVLKNKIHTNLKKYIGSYLKLVKLEEYGDKYPDVLSGGMKRRVGIARGFAFPSKYLLMDEPFEFLDIGTKGAIIKDFKRLQNMLKKSVVFITHDIDSALDLGDNIVVLGGYPTKVIGEFKNSKDRDKLKLEIENLFL